MPTRSLTAASVARIKPPKAGQVDYSDRGYPGLALRCSYGGAKAWVFFYRRGGKLRRLSLGRFPGMSLTEARDAWRAARLAVSKGESPAHIRPTTADTFAATAEEWLKRDQAQNRSAREVRRVIERDVNPVWGERLIAAITRRDALELIDGVADRGAVTMARRLHSHLHRLFKWSVGRGIIEVNPMSDLPKPGAAVKRDRVLTDSELVAVWKAAERTPWPFGAAVRLLILTAARRDEIGSLKWQEIHGNEIRLPGERSKTGEPRIIPLSSAAMQLINTLPRVGEHVFSSNGSGLGGWSRAKRSIDATAVEMNGGPVQGWRLHDLRRTTATGMQRLGVGLQVVEDVLGHVSGSRAGIVGIYQLHKFEAEKRSALNAWALEVERIAAGKKADRTPEVHFAEVRFSGSGSLTVNTVDVEWVRAVKRADRIKSFAPLVEYLYRPGIQWSPAEYWWLQRLLLPLQYPKRKKRGPPVPVGLESREAELEIGVAYYDKQRDEGRSSEEALDDAAAATHPQRFGDGEDGRANFISSLATFIKRGRRLK